MTRWSSSPPRCGWASRSRSTRRSLRAAGALAGVADRVLRDPPLAEEWTFRYLAAAHEWAATEHAVAERIGADDTEIAAASAAPDPTTAELRAWARAPGLTVPDHGRLRPEVWHAWRGAHTPDKERP